MEVTVEGMDMDVREEQPWKAYLVMYLTPSEMVAETREEQP